MGLNYWSCKQNALIALIASVKNIPVGFDQYKTTKTLKNPHIRKSTYNRGIDKT